MTKKFPLESALSKGKILQLNMTKASHIEFCFTCGRSRTHDSFYGGNRRKPDKTLVFVGFTQFCSIA